MKHNYSATTPSKTFGEPLPAPTVIAIWEMIGDCLVVTLQIKMINDVVLTLIQQRILSKSQGANKMGPSI